MTMGLQLNPNLNPSLKKERQRPCSWNVIERKEEEEEERERERERERETFIDNQIDD